IETRIGVDDCIGDAIDHCAHGWGLPPGIGLCGLLYVWPRHDTRFPAPRPASVWLWSPHPPFSDHNHTFAAHGAAHGASAVGGGRRAGRVGTINYLSPRHAKGPESA